MNVSQWEPSQWVAVLGGIAGIIAALTTVVKVLIDRRAGIDSKEISTSELELASDQQAFQHLRDVLTELRADRDDLRTRVEILERKLGDQAVEIAQLLDVIRLKDAKIEALTADIILLLEHIHAGRQPPPPKLRGYRGEEETHE